MLESVSNPAFTNSNDNPIQTLIQTNDTSLTFIFTSEIDSVSLTAFLPVDSPVLDALLVGSSPSDVAGEFPPPFFSPFVHLAFLTQNR
jgi:hypothetical protein